MEIEFKEGSITRGPWRGLSRKEASEYIGISMAYFDKLVKSGELPKPICLGSRIIWDIKKLDQYFDSKSNDEISTWDRSLGI